jgi:Flp pilus assembly protein TadG
MPRLKRLTTDSAESGNASLEFLTVGMILLVPLVYLVLTLAQLQSGAFAVEGAARQAARVYVQSANLEEAEESAARAIEFALADYGIDGSTATVDVSCSPNPNVCLTRQGFVTITVATSVSLPLVPPFLNLGVPLSVPLSASASQQVSRFWGSR